MRIGGAGVGYLCTFWSSWLGVRGACDETLHLRVKPNSIVCVRHCTYSSWMLIVCCLREPNKHPCLMRCPNLMHCAIMVRVATGVHHPVAGSDVLKSLPVTLSLPCIVDQSAAMACTYLRGKPGRFGRANS